MSCESWCTPSWPAPGRRRPTSRPVPSAGLPLDSSALEPANDLSRRDVVESLLRRYRVRPEKRLGQNFLIDHQALDQVVSAGELGGANTLREAGAGVGAPARPAA